MIKTNITGVEILVEESEHYLQANDIDTANIHRLWLEIKSRYSNYDVMFCYHNTNAPLEFMRSINAVLADDSVEMRLTHKCLQSSNMYHITQVTETDFNIFAAFHDKRNPKMYWKSERIRQDLARWGIFILWSDRQIAGYILVAMWNLVQAEIFCVETTELAQAEALIAAASAFAFEKGKTEVLYMDDENTLGHKAALAIGFRVTGYYQGYVVRKINEE